MKNKTLRKAAWVCYDFANSAYVLIVPAVAFPLYYRQIALGGGPNADASWAVIVAIAMLIAGVVSPFIGAIVDASGQRRLALTIATLTCVGSTAGLYFATPEMGHLGAVLFVIGQVAWVVATLLYDSFLKTLAGDRSSHFLSGLGWGLGYAGGILCLFLTYPLLKGGLAPENLANYRLAFLVTSAFYLVFSLPTLLILPSRDVVSVGNSGTPWRAYSRVFTTVRNWKAYKPIFLFLIGFYLLSDGVTTVIYFTSIYLSQTFSMPIDRILMLTVVIQAVGIVTTPLFGFAADKLPEKRALLATVVIWCLAVVVMAFGTGGSAPIWMAILIGLVIGSSQAICRGIYARIVPEEKQAEFFGFNALAGRVATLLGPLTFGLVSTSTGSQRAGLISLLFFFIAGGLVISFCKLSPNPSTDEHTS